jgi:tetratricopeptide (TPR) repeat protein
MAAADADSGRRGRKPRVQLVPESNVPVEIAMEALEEAGSDIGVAKELLTKQSKLVQWQIRTEQLRFLTKAGLAFLAVMIAGVAGVMVAAAMKSHEVIVQAFETPPSLASRGISGKVVASSLQDALAHIQEETRTTAKQRNISNEWTSDINVEMPQTGVSIGEIDRMLRRRLGRNTYVDGDVVVQASGALSLTVRSASIPSRAFTGPPDKLDDLARQAAEYVYGRAEPTLFAVYLNQNDRYQETIDFVGGIYSEATDAQRAALANSWGNALSTVGRNPEALEKYRLSVGIDPYRWSTWGNIIGVGMQTFGEAYAVAESKRMRQAIADAPSDKQPAPGDEINTNLLFQEWTDLVDGQIKDAAASGGGTATTTNNTAIADGEARRHDFVSANRYLVAASNSDSTKEPTQWMRAGMQALEAGRPTDALPPLQKLDVAFNKDPDVAFAFMDGPCWLGLAYGLSGRTAEADALFRRMGRWVSCYTFQADILEAQGKRPEADAAYARAAALVPAMPFAYEHWGRALLARGDLEGAQLRFRQSQERGPRWADSYEGLGEVYVRAGKWAAADQQFAKAAPLAPNWSRLNRLWAQALFRLGRNSDAQQRLKLAAING